MKIVVVTGASGGHIFPAIAFCEAVKETRPGVKTLLVLPRGTVANAVDFGSQPVRMIPATAIRPAIGPDTCISVWRFCLALARSLDILLGFKPDIVVGFGSLASVPVVLTAWLLRIPTVLHEQNVVPGRANRFLSRIADRVAVSFEESRELFPSQRRIIVTGNPVRRQMRRIPQADARAALGLASGIFTVVVTGGSQGSDTINRRFIEAIRSFPRANEVQVIHISGPAQYNAVTAAYTGYGSGVKIVPFLKQMELAYSAADVALCRAGATTCAELQVYSLPALLVPYPFAQGHQSRNAAVLEKRGCVAVIRDADLDPGAIAGFLERCVNDPAFLPRMKQSYRAAGQDAACKLAQEWLEALR
jgi:UDP-N-acetylglucosamine--N-acetylmuramyl-(pentapeptide) pyrophosphoryl-undecaprenol N-acetylglucosamine transferase